MHVVKRRSADVACKSEQPADLIAANWKCMLSLERRCCCNAVQCMGRPERGAFLGPFRALDGSAYAISHGGLRVPIDSHRFLFTSAAALHPLGDPPRLVDKFTRSAVAVTPFCDSRHASWQGAAIPSSVEAPSKLVAEQRARDFSPLLPAAQAVLCLPDRLIQMRPGALARLVSCMCDSAAAPCGTHSGAPKRRSTQPGTAYAAALDDNRVVKAISSP